MQVLLAERNSYKWKFTYGEWAASMLFVVFCLSREMRRNIITDKCTVFAPHSRLAAILSSGRDHLLAGLSLASSAIKQKPDGFNEIKGKLGLFASYWNIN
jgi:hypothetical protein